MQNDPNQPSRKEDPKNPDNRSDADKRRDAEKATKEAEDNRNRNR